MLALALLLASGALATIGYLGHASDRRRALVATSKIIVRRISFPCMVIVVSSGLESSSEDASICRSMSVQS